MRKFIIKNNQGEITHQTEAEQIKIINESGLIGFVNKNGDAVAYYFPQPGAVIGVGPEKDITTETVTQVKPN